MHHLIQSNMFNETGYARLVNAVKEMNLPYGIFKLRPFDHEIQWEEGIISGGAKPTMVWGTLSVERAAARYGWHPGVFKNENFSMKVLDEKWGPRMLNSDAKFYKLGEVPSWEGAMFMRPVHDTKSFVGQLMNGDEFEKWREDLFALRDEFTTVDLNTEVMIASPKHVIDEARFFVVDKQVVAGSMYRIDGHVLYKGIDSNTPLYMPMWEWANAHCYGTRYAGDVWYTIGRAGAWAPHEAFVMDVARTEEGFSIIEVNCINSAGFYDCNMGSVVRALEYLHPWPERWKVVDNDNYKPQPWEKVIDDRELDEWRKNNSFGHVVDGRAASSIGRAFDS